MGGLPGMPWSFLPWPFDRTYMQLALLAGIVVGAAAPLIGVFLVQKGLSLMGDGIGHVALTGVGADYAFDAVGRSSLVQAGLLATRPGGTVVCVGAAPIDDPVVIAPAALFVLSEKKLLGCALGSSNSVRDIPRLLALWQGGRLDLEGLVTARRPLAEINTALEDLKAGRGIRTILAV